MASSKKYFHDHLVLLLLSVNAFLALAGSIFILLQLLNGHGNIIAQCRDCSNQTDVNRFTVGGVADILSFIVFAIFVFVAHYFLSRRAYQVHRQLAITILGLGILLLVLTIIISNALLVLR